MEKHILRLRLLFLKYEEACLSKPQQSLHFVLSVYLDMSCVHRLDNGIEAQTSKPSWVIGQAKNITPKGTFFDDSFNG